MSRLSRMLVAHRTNDKSYSIIPLRTATVEHEAISSKVAAATIYNLSLKLSVNVHVDDNTKDTYVEDHRLEEARRVIVEDVFGEFRPLLLDIRFALMNRDIEGATVALKKLEHEMFTPL